MKSGSALGVWQRAFSRRLPTAMAQVQYQIRSYVIHGRQGTGTVFLRVLWFPPANAHSTDCSTLISNMGHGHMGNSGRQTHPKKLKRKYCLTFEILKAVIIHIVVFWVLTPCSLVGAYRRFERTCCHYFQGGNVLEGMWSSYIVRFQIRRIFRSMAGGRKMEIRPGQSVCLVNCCCSRQHSNSWFCV
jgi:hypothetical protein